MGIVNRSMDASEQKDVIQRTTALSVGASAGANFHLGMVPYPAVLKAVEVAHVGLSGAPTAQIDVIRFVAGAGLTQITGLAATHTAVAVGTSGVQGLSLQAAGNTLLILQRGDVLVWNQLFSGGNVGTSQSTITAVVQKTQDIVQHFGSSS